VRFHTVDVALRIDKLCSLRLRLLALQECFHEQNGYSDNEQRENGEANDLKELAERTAGTTTDRSCLGSGLGFPFRFAVRIVRRIRGRYIHAADIIRLGIIKRQVSSPLQCFAAVLDRLFIF